MFCASSIIITEIFGFFLFEKYDINLSGVKTKINFLFLYSAGISGLSTIRYFSFDKKFVKSRTTCVIKARVGTKNAMFSLEFFSSISQLIYSANRKDLPNEVPAEKL